MAVRTHDILTNPQDWVRVEAIASRLLDASSDDRPRILDEACPEGDPLRLAVERIVEAATANLDFLEGPAARHLGEPLLTLSGDPQPPAHLGSYALIRRLGAGGMGQVWLAERADGAFQRRVAIKWLPAFADRESIVRLEAERKILALIDHPHVARLYDGGIDPDGHPYLVTELVDGEPIDVFCARRRLPLNQRLDLVVDLCSAVGAIHCRGLVHRDLKPANVLVTGDAVVKLVDFGIARPVRSIRGLDTSLTRTGGRPMTPGYASPEQVMGLEIAPATDLHGLGLILFELTTGRRAFARTGASVYEVERQITEGTPPCPSESILNAPAEQIPLGKGRSAILQPPGPPLRLRRLLASGIDALVVRSLAKRPDQRYRSAEDLARQIRRIQADMRQPAWRRWLSTSRLLHRVGLVVTLAAVFLLSGRPLIDAHGATDPEVRFELERALRYVEGAAESRSMFTLLPLVPADGDTQRILALAVDQELRRRLSAIVGIRLVGIESSERISRSHLDPAAIASYLGASIVLRGDVAAREDGLRTRLRAFRAADSSVAFEASFDSSFGQVGAEVQSMVAELAMALELPPPALDFDPPLWDRRLEEEITLIRSARYLGPTLSSEPLIVHLRRALELNPESLATKSEWVRRFAMVSCRRGIPSDRAHRWVQEVIADDPRSATAWTAAGLQKIQTRNWRGAAKALRVALELGGGTPDSLQWAAHIAMMHGLDELSWGFVRQYVAIDPFSAEARRNLGLIRFLAGRHDEALASLLDATAVQPQSSFSHLYMAQIHLVEGRPEAALKAASAIPGTRWRLFAESLVVGPKANGSGRLAELIEHHGKEMAYQVAAVYAFHGDAARAFHWLDRAEAYGDCGLAMVSADPMMASLADEPRMKSLISRLGLTSVSR